MVVIYRLCYFSWIYYLSTRSCNWPYCFHLTKNLLLFPRITCQVTKGRASKDSCSCTLPILGRPFPALLFPLSISGFIFRLCPSRKHYYQFRKWVWQQVSPRARPSQLRCLIQNKDLVCTSLSTAELSPSKCIRRWIKSSGSIYPNWPACSCQWRTTGRAQFPPLVANSWVS